MDSSKTYVGSSHPIPAYKFSEDTKCSSLSPKPFDKLIYIEDGENIKNTFLSFKKTVFSRKQRIVSYCRFYHKTVEKTRVFPTDTI